MSRLRRRTPSTAPLALALCLLAGCGASPDGSRDADVDGPTDAGLDAPADDADGQDVGPGDASPADGDAPAADADLGEDAEPEPVPCRTRVTYGSAWLRPDGHDEDHDVVAGVVTWDGACHIDGSGNSWAELSNGWRPYFRGASACVIALDASGDCDPTPPAGCTTRITYGASWQHPSDHPSDYDQVSGVVTWDGECDGGSGTSWASLSNGWVPHFTGAGSCELSLRYEQCGGLYANPVLDSSCPDPGVAFDGTEYVMACTGGENYPIRTSSDLVHWTRVGDAFEAVGRPSWADGSFWAPEIHRVGDLWVLYFSARNVADGRYALGGATATSPSGPYTDIGHPLLVDPSPGVIDAHFFEAPDGARYLLWKLDGNAVGSPTPIYIQQLGDDGLTLIGARHELIRNDQGWEGAVVEGPWMIYHDGRYYLFYSGNGYATSRYAVGVARGDSPLGPFSKLPEPILTSNGSFGGPGHGSVLRGPSGSWVHVYHSWLEGSVGESPGRLVLVDRIDFRDGWPHMDASPSPWSQPMP